MSIVFFLSEDGSTEVALDSVTSVQVSYPATVASTSVMDGRSVGHDVHEGNATIVVSGRVTYSKSIRQTANPDPIKFQQEILALRRARKRFTVFVEEGYPPLLQDFKDCVIANFEVSAETYKDAIGVSLTFEQVFVSAAARTTYLAPVKASSSKTTTTSAEDTGQTTPTDKTEAQSKTIWKSSAEAVGIDGTFATGFGNNQDA